VVEGASLENWCAGNGTVGSNPTLSAINMKYFLATAATISLAATIYIIYLFTKLAELDVAAVIALPVIIGLLIVLLSLDCLFLYLTFRNSKKKPRFLRLP
jgi:hypothetical protein